eukprot:2830463-Rhodomonas_salina.1
METHPDHAAVQEEGCGALWNLALNKDNKVAIGKKEGNIVGERMLAAMRAHPSHAAVQEYGCRALAMLASKVSNFDYHDKIT